MSSWKDSDPSYLWPWLMVLLALGIVVLLALWVRVWVRRTPRDAAYVAHATRLRALPRYQVLVRRQIAFGTALTLAALVACTGAILLAGRLQQTRTMERSEANRDIMLCLDSSGSMAEADAEVLAEFQTIVEGLQGERIGLTIWSGAAITVFPLTDDYSFAQEQLRIAQAAFGAGGVYSSSYEEFTAGTVLDYDVQSQLGDGLVSCVQRFDRDEEDRARAIILASDNDPIGEGIYTFTEAADYAMEHDVVVHGIAAPETTQRSDAAAEFEQQVTRTAGTFSVLGADGSAEQIVESIDALEAKKIEKPPVVQMLDRPERGTVVAAVGVGLLALVWLVQGVLALVDRSRAVGAGGGAGGAGSAGGAAGRSGGAGRGGAR